MAERTKTLLQLWLRRKISLCDQCVDGDKVWKPRGKGGQNWERELASNGICKGAGSGREHKNCNIVYYYVDKSVLVENRPLVKFIQNYIWDLSGIFSIPLLVRISMTSFPALTLLQKYMLSCLYNKKKITQWLEDMNFIFEW